MSARDIYDERRWDPKRGGMVGVNYGGTVHQPRTTYSDIPFGGGPLLSTGPKYGESSPPAITDFRKKGDIASIMGDNPAMLDPSFRGAPSSPQIIYPEGQTPPMVPPADNDPSYERGPSMEQIFLNQFYKNLFN